MHQIRISPELQAQVRAERGAPHIFDKLDMRRTAHVIVDLQNGFMEPGAPVEVPVAREIVGAVNKISAAVRERGGQNIFLRMTIDDDSQASWSNWFAYMHSGASRLRMAEAFTRDAHYWRLWPQLDFMGTDVAIDKTRFGAFVPGASRLHEFLQKRVIDTLIITGTLTNCCCESTARDAMQMNYKIIFVADANAALTDAALKRGDGDPVWCKRPRAQGPYNDWNGRAGGYLCRSMSRSITSHTIATTDSFR